MEIPESVPPLIRLAESVPVVILFADKFGMRTGSKVPEVILEQLSSGMRTGSKVPDVILEQFSSGILDVVNCPEVIWLAGNPLIWLAFILPTVILSARKWGNGNIVTSSVPDLMLLCIQVCDTDDITVNSTRCNVARIQVLDGHIGCVNRAAANSVGRHSARCNLTGIDTDDVCVSDL